MTQANRVHSSPRKPASEFLSDLPEHAPVDLRLFVEAEVEQLLVFLDRLDGDCDLECYLTDYSSGMDDREADCEDESAQR